MSERERSERDLADLAGAYAADALPDEERDAFERYLEREPEAEAEARELRAAAAELGAGVSTRPPAALRERVLAEVRETPQLAPLSDASDATAPTGSAPAGDVARASDAAPPRDLDARRRARASVPRWVATAGGLAAAALVAGVVSLSVVTSNLSADLDAERRASAQLTSLLADPDVVTASGEGPDGATARVVASPAQDQAVFVTDGLGPAPDDQTYQLWHIGDAIVPAGLFSVDEDGRAVTALEPGIDAAEVVGVTLEPQGGSDQPTSDPLLVLEWIG